MSLDDEQMDSILAEIERELERTPKRNRNDRDLIGVIILYALLTIIRLGAAAGLAYLAWTNWPGANVFNTPLANLTLHDVLSVIFAPLFAFAVPYLLVIGWEIPDDMLPRYRD